MQHFLLIRDDPTEDGARMFQLIDALLSYLVMDRVDPDGDVHTLLNFSLQGILDRLQTDDQAKRAFGETKEALKVAAEARAERDHMQQMLNLGSNGVIAKLQRELDEANQLLRLQRRINESLKQDLDELKRTIILSSKIVNWKFESCISCLRNRILMLQLSPTQKSKPWW